jgi:hypothetical protein
LHPVADALRAAAVGLVLLVVLCEVAAADETQPIAAYQDGAVLAARVDGANATTTTEVTTLRSRLVAPAAPLANADGRPISELAGVNYRWWMSHGRADLGVGVGSVGYLQTPADGRLDGPRTLSGSVPTVTLGVRYHVSSESHVFADASSARGLGADPTGNYYNTKVGVEWKPAKSRIGFDQGVLGMHFDSGYKLSLKARHGGLALYLRSQF